MDWRRGFRREGVRRRAELEIDAEMNNLTIFIVSLHTRLSDRFHFYLALSITIDLLV